MTGEGETPFVIAQVNLHPKVIRETCEPDVEHLMARMGALKLKGPRWPAWIARCREKGLVTTLQILEDAHAEYERRRHRLEVRNG